MPEWLAIEELRATTEAVLILPGWAIAPIASLPVVGLGSTGAPVIATLAAAFDAPVTLAIAFRSPALTFAGVA